MVLKINIKQQRTKIQSGDRVVLNRPAESEQHESPGWHPWLDRYLDTALTVSTVAQGEGYQLVLVYETIVPIRGDWLTPI
jgi:hypothetical protein